MSLNIGCGVVVITTIVVCLSVAIRGSVEPEFYSFGAGSGDDVLPPSNDGASPELSLSTPFVFYGNSRETVFVNNNGLLSFGGPVAQFNPSPFPLQGLEVIAPYWADVDTRGSGTVFYRETNDTELLARITNCLQESYPSLNGTLNPGLLFIATWDHVGYFDQNTDRTNTFQCVLVIDGARSFVVFLYAEIQWTTGDASGGENGLGGTPAKAGVNTGDGIRHFSIPGSLTDAIINITNTSNIGVPGVWVFRTDGDSILQPGADCGSNLELCDQNAQCFNMPPGRFGCVCNAGFSGNGSVCTDIDECSQMAGADTGPELPCEQICINLPGSFTCGCNDGYVLAADGTSCNKIAGCEAAGFMSCCTEACFVEQGTCFCDQDCYDFGDCCDDIRNICQPEDPCASGFHNCSDNATCVDTELGFNCSCNNGFTGNGTFCSDIDECATGNANCSSDAACTNVFGSFLCDCNVGYTGDGISCTDIDECNSLDNEVSSEGNATNGSPCDQICSNVPGSFQCDCEVGYQLSSDGHTCDDVDECNRASNGSFNSSSPCEQICINTPGSFQCACNDNFVLISDGSSCVPITNCSSAGFNGCCEVADCFIDLANCFCDESCRGFDDCCEDISETCPPDECRLGLANCDVNAICTDTEEGFNCTCIPGYDGNGVNCSDIDECDSTPCNQICNNTPGSFFCSCMENFLLINSSFCIRDVCGTEAADNCSLNAQCDNVDSELGFVCTCNPGYTGSGFNCTDINECESEESNLCQQNCSNTIGSFQCSCGEEFILASDGTSCSATGCISSGFTGCCSGQCLVEAGSCFCDSTCFDFDDCCADIEQTCPEGAADVDECALDTANCSADADCTNTDGSFLCSCQQGYTGDGFLCTDVDECNTEMDICSQVCLNNPGSFMCGCREGFLLDTDGKSCRGVEIGLQETSYTIAESAGSAEICIQLSRALTANTTLLLTSEAGTATESEDYLSISEELQLSPSSSILFCVDVPILEDNAVENTETFSVLLNSNDSVVNITAGFATVTITDNDNVEATFTEVLYSVRETSGSVAVCVSLLGTLERNVTLLLRTEDRRARAPGDYININEELIFPSGSNATMCVQITVILDGIVEDTELFAVVLSTSDSSVIIARGTTLVAIINSDVSVGIVQELFLFNEDVGKAEVCVQLSGGVNANINVTLNSHEGTATSGADYTDISETITFTQTTVTCVYISIIDDCLAELPESFSIQLSTTSPAITLRNCSATIIIVDNDAAVRLVNSTPLFSRMCRCTFSITIRLERLREDIQSISCRLSSDIQGDCSDGSITFRNLPSGRREPYILRVLATLSDGRYTVLTRMIRLGGNGDCTAILLNDGLVINGDSIEVEWQGVGPTSTYDCRLDNTKFVPCESPFKAAGIINGNHRLKIRPRGGNCRSRILRKFNFTIFQSNITAPQTGCSSVVL